jgi:hypothetical protein
MSETEKAELERGEQGKALAAWRKTREKSKHVKRTKVTEIQNAKDIKTIEDIPAIFRLEKPEYFNNSTQQLFFDRERYLKQMLIFREMVATAEMEIAITSCPWRLGDIVNYNPLDGRTKSKKAMIVEIKFKVISPYYTVIIKEFYGSGQLVPKYRRKIDKIEHIMGATNVPLLDGEAYCERLLRLIKLGIITIPRYVPVDDTGNFMSKIVKSIERGNTLTRLSPLAEMFLKESLKVGLKGRILK